jgi:hypothetical protein
MNNMDEKIKNIEQISYFDDDFPKEIKAKVPYIEQCIDEALKWRSWRIWFNALLNSVYFEFVFNYKTIGISLDYEFVKNESIERIFYTIKKCIDKEYKKEWLRDEYIY